MKITKRQRKLQKALERSRSSGNPSGLSAAFQRSLKNGNDIRIAGSLYQGAVPQFTPVMGNFNMILGYRKIVKGVPFVRVA